ncbi:hypothetical protein D2L64_06905 [Micromonospora radicis]|uniref:Uncharacterized protein n=1 Tax=Micromonospora radicis TaxID=1894971 RepID=A0A418MYE6_9ACTN|nr:hypothetical protein D2L64_06905 [Micromonospora radicis]
MMVAAAVQVPARAADPVAFDDAAAHAALFSAAVQLTGPDSAGVKNAVVTAELLDWREANPTAGSEEITAHLALVRARADKAVPDGADDGQSRFGLAMAVLAGLGVRGESETDTDAPVLNGPQLRRVLTSTVGVEGANVVEDALDLVRGGFQDSAWNAQVREVMDQTFADLHRRASTDAALAIGWDAAFAARTSTSVRASAATLLGVRIHPPRPDNPGTIGHYVPLAAIKAASADRTSYRLLVQEQATRVLQVLDQDGVVRTTEVINYSTTYVLNGNTPDEATRAAEKQKTDSNKVIFEGLGKSVSILSTLMGFTDKAFAGHLQIIGDAMVTSVTAINTYMTTVLNAGLTTAATVLGTAVLTGNLLGAAMSLVKLFTGANSDPNAMIMAEIKKLQQQISRLADGMDKRFDRIETALNTMYGDLVGMLTELTRSVEEIKAKLGEITTQLHTIERKVDSMALAIHVALQSIAESPLRSVITTYVHHEAIASEPIPDYINTYFPKAESPTFTFATLTAKDQGTYTVPEGTSLADPLSELDKYLPDGAINYLTAWAANRLGAQWPNARVANPAAWGTAARTYNILQLQNPAFAARVLGSRATAIAKVGDDINAQVRQFSAPAEDGGTNELFATLLQDYRDAMKAWAEQAEAVRRSVLWNGFDVPLPEYDLWGDADQQIAAKIAESSAMAACSGNLGSRAVPATLRRSTLPNPYHLADHGLPTDQRPQFATCFDAQFVNVVENDGPRLQTKSGDLQITVRSRVQWHGGAWHDAQTATRVFPVGVYCSMRVLNNEPSGYCYDETHFLNERWNASYRTAFESAPVPPVVDATETARKKAAAMLAGRQKYYYTVMVDGTGVNRPANFGWDSSRLLWEKGQAVTRAVRLLQAYSQLGWATALERDDALNGLLYGTHALPGDWTAPRTDVNQAVNQHFAGAFRHALAQYAGCRQEGWNPCADDVSGFEPQDDLPRYGADCAQVEVPGKPQDPVSACLVSAASLRSGQLSDRYAHWSGQIKTGSHVEGLPKVAALANMTRAANANLH